MRAAKWLASVALVFWALGATPAAAAGQRVQLTGEIMDTWCYVSEIMGASEAVLGTAHHQCAVWCAAGGVPVGLLSEAGEIFMILKLGDEDTSNADPRILEIQSSRVTVDGDLYERDGIKYLLIDEVVANEGIVNRSHEDFGVIPAFGVPKQ
jgi:hypothetical protein